MIQLRTVAKEPLVICQPLSTLPSSFQRASDLWQPSSRPSVTGNRLIVAVEDRNAAVIHLQ